MMNTSLQFVDTVTFLAKDGGDVADDIKGFIAPIAAILVALVGLKYLFGESRSLVGFISFLLLGIIVYALIIYGEQVLNWSGQLFAEWVDDGPSSQESLPVWLLTAVAGAVVATAVWQYVGRARGKSRSSDEPVMPSLSSTALELLADIGPTDLRTLRRLRDQAILTRAVAANLHAIDESTPALDEQVVQIVVLADQWPGLSRTLQADPSLLGDVLNGDFRPKVDEAALRVIRATDTSNETFHRLLAIAPLRDAQPRPRDLSK